MKYHFFFQILNCEFSPRLTRRYPDSRGSCTHRSVYGVLCLYWHLVQTQLDKTKIHVIVKFLILCSITFLKCLEVPSFKSTRHQVLIHICINFTDIKQGQCWILLKTNFTVHVYTYIHTDICWVLLTSFYCVAKIRIFLYKGKKKIIYQQFYEDNWS